jgi:glycine cleavage system H lipoate-binding protein
MACPFLAEGRAQYCHAAPMRKLILDGPGVSGGGLCTSPQYRQCEFVAKDLVQQDCCPHLEEVRVQYCGASPITKLVPFSETQLSRCTSGGYRYCDSYLAHANPHGTTAPANLFYAPNHFWLDVDESGLCHIGIDDFLADVAGHVEGIAFATLEGTHCPGLTIVIHGVEWPTFFPNAMMIQKINHRVRTDPSRLTGDPYGVGWLFEGRELAGVTRTGLLSGAEAAAWQKGERARLAREIHEMHAPACDGGLPVGGVARLLSRPDLICLCQDFFGNSAWPAEEQ